MKKNVKWFLVQRFLIILFCIYWGVEGIDLLYRLVAAPAVRAFLEIQQIEITGSSDVVGWLLQLLFYFLTGFMPTGVREWVRWQIDEVMGNSVYIDVSSPLYTGAKSWFLWLMIIGGLLWLLLIKLFPYLLGALCYSRIVVRQFNDLLAQEEAQKLARDQRRNLVLSDIAHDIKTPLTTVCGYSKALLEGVVEEKNRQAYLDAIYRKAMRMDELITLLFEYVKLESEGFTLHREPGDLAELMSEMTALI